jgi:hypothetical protein
VGCGIRFPPHPGLASLVSALSPKKGGEGRWRWVRVGLGALGRLSFGVHGRDAHATRGGSMAGALWVLCRGLSGSIMDKNVESIARNGVGDGVC